MELAATTFSGKSLNVSVGGMALELTSADARTLVVGARVTVRLDLGSGAFALTKGEITRVTRRELGLRFVSLDRASLLALLTCVGSDAPPPLRQPA
jgi:hypothetical protein